MRSLLSSYYGSALLGDKRCPRPPIDTPDFDCDAYVERLVRETPLDALQTRCAEMAGEIRSLDSDMQMLVYENYSKFIVATDTIRRMKSNVEGMEAKMEELRVTVASTAERSEAVNARLGAHRDQVEQLSGVRGLISKLQAVFELPRKMRTCLDRGAVALAVRYYARRRAPLRKYGTRARSRRRGEKRTPPPPTRRIRYDARSRTPPTPRSDEETHARRQERGRSPRRRTTEPRRRTIRRRRTTRRRRPRTRTPR